MEDLPQEFSLFRETITFIRTNLANNIKVEDLSQRMKLSENQFRRKFKEEFSVTPQQFILRARLQATGNLLRNGNKPIAIIAAECGFSDQSYFTKKFKPFFGETPLQYRRRWNNSWNRTWWNSYKLSYFLSILWKKLVVVWSCSWWANPIVLSRISENQRIYLSCPERCL